MSQNTDKNIQESEELISTEDNSIFSQYREEIPLEHLTPADEDEPIEEDELEPEEIADEPEDDTRMFS